MDIEALQKLCNSFPGVSEDIKWAHDLCFSIAGKPFLVIGLDQVPASASFKVPDEQFESVISKNGFKPAPYVAKYKWVLIEDINLINKKEWIGYIQQSYDLVKSKLPKKVQAELNKPVKKSKGK